MVCPAASVRPSKAIETPAAWPVTTTWKASNSFCAAAKDADVGAVPAGCASGRIFCAAGATQTWAAEAEPAVASSAAMRGSDFMMGLLGWLLPETPGALRFASPTQRPCGFFPANSAAPCADLRVPRANGVLRARETTRHANGRRFPHNGANRRFSAAEAGFADLRVTLGTA